MAKIYQSINSFLKVPATITLGVAILVLGGIGISLTQAHSSVQNSLTLSTGEAQLLAGATERIDRYRKGEATVLVFDAAGRPLSNVTIHAKMLKHDFLFGCNLFLLGRCGSESLNTAYAERFASLFNYATLPFYWSIYEPSPGRDSRYALQAMATWARDHGIRTKGHPLVWGTLTSFVPSWTPQSTDELENALQIRVTREVKQFCGLIDFWDIVNEPAGAELFHANNPVVMWMKARTPATAVATALGWARSSCNETALIINDFRTDEAFLAVLQGARAQGGKFDAIGIQSHMHRGLWKLDQAWDICERFKDFGVPLHFTEVTVLSGELKKDYDWETFQPGWDTTQEGETTQADYVANFYTILFSHPAVEAITWWDLSDKGAWLGAPGGLLRKDMSPKPAYERLMKLIHEEWHTDVNVTTDVEGKAVWQGFYGQYRLTAMIGMQKVETEIHLKSGQTNLFRIEIPVTVFTSTPAVTQPPSPPPLRESPGMPPASEPSFRGWMWAIGATVFVAISAVALWLYISRRRHQAPKENI